MFLNVWQTRIGMGLLLATMLGLAACQPIQPVTPVPVAEAATFDDPFAYCAAVGTVDAPDARFTGPDVPDLVAEGLRDALNTPNTPLEVFIGNSFWRCMNGEVYACTVGANLPCQTKGDLFQTPTDAMVDFCKENVGSDFIPMAVTGRATVYNWTCDEETPVAGEQIFEVDEQGFLSSIWYRLSPPE
jgi:hypothetical protein